MNVELFEKTLAFDISDSIEKCPEDWEKSIWGIARKSDKLELNISSNGVSIKHPHEYSFKIKSYEKKLFNVANKIHGKIVSDYETKIYNEILDSLTNQADDWVQSIWGIERRNITPPGGEWDYDDKVELSVSDYSDLVEVKKPYTVVFENEKYAKHLYKVASK